MNITDYIAQLVAELGFNSLEEAKEILPQETLLNQAEAFYRSNKGADGTVLWTEVLSALK